MRSKSRFMTLVLREIFGVHEFLAQPLEAVDVPSSSVPISQLYPATSAARIAANLRSTRSDGTGNPSLAAKLTASTRVGTCRSPLVRGCLLRVKTERHGQPA